MENKSIISGALETADWLFLNQKKDGHFLLKTDPESGENGTDDPLRSALTGWSLAEFGKSINREKYIGCARKNLSYFKKEFLEKDHKMKYRENVLSYIGQEACSLGDMESASLAAENILEIIRRENLSTISYQPIAALFFQMSEIDRTFQKEAIDACRKIKSAVMELMETPDSFKPGIHAEIINIFPKASAVSEDNSFQKMSVWLADFFAANQLPSGAYKTSLMDTAPNSRNTGKIAEVLASFVKNENLKEEEKERYGKSLVKALGWVLSMQYRQCSLPAAFSVDLNEKISGGIRHTLADPQIWIDSSAHYLLAVSRLLDGGTLDPPSRSL